MEILYIGAKDGVEKKMVEKVGVEFRGVACGKLRRYFSLQNFVDIFKVPVGTWEALKILREVKPNVIFSKGGFVSVPVVLAAKKLGIPVILHESDLVPGLANKICARYAKKICISFEESKEFFEKFAKKGARIIYTGNPIRKNVVKGKKDAGYKLTGFDHHRPVVLIMGGSQGAQQINDLVRASLDELLKKFQIVHIRGRGNLDISLHKKGYVQYEYLDEQMKDVYAMCEMIVSRGGANSLAEIALLRKKALIIPLGTAGSRGDQIDNAKIFSRKFGWSILSGDISREDFIGAIESAYRGKVNKVEDFKNGVDEIVKLILGYKLSQA